MASRTEYKNGGWFIKIGNAGFNSPANNRFGYKSQASAEAAIDRYLAKGEAHRKAQARAGVLRMLGYNS